MKYLKSKVRKNEKPLEQLINRYSKIYIQHPNNILSDTNTSTILSKPHKNGPLIGNNNRIQYKMLTINKIKININTSQDNYILTESGEVVNCLNFVKNEDGSISLIGKCFKIKQQFYNNPVDSSLFDIFHVDQLAEELCECNINNVKKKFDSYT